MSMVKEKRKPSKKWKYILQGMPIAAAAGLTFLPLQRLGQQFIMLIVLLWLQAFFIIEVFLLGK